MYTHTVYQTNTVNVLGKDKKTKKQAESEILLVDSVH